MKEGRGSSGFLEGGGIKLRWNINISERPLDLSVLESHDKRGKTRSAKLKHGRDYNAETERRTEGNKPGKETRPPWSMVLEKYNSSHNRDNHDEHK